MHNKSDMYKLLKDKLKTGLSLKNNKLIAELRQLPSSPCDIADSVALYYYPITSKFDKALVDRDIHIEFVLSDELVNILRSR